jgi:hypothetical protein
LIRLDEGDEIAATSKIEEQEDAGVEGDETITSSDTTTDAPAENASETTSTDPSPENPVVD